MERYWTSGQTQRVFAREAGIGVSTLQYWLCQRRTQRGQRGKRRKASGGSGPAPAAVAFSLLEVELAGGAATNRRNPERFEIELPGGTQLRFGAGFAEGEVRRLLNLLREVR
jgi:hypothetical protein